VLVAVGLAVAAAIGVLVAVGLAVAAGVLMVVGLAVATGVLMVVGLTVGMGVLLVVGTGYASPTTIGMNDCPSSGVGVRRRAADAGSPPFVS
jgi:hypothetical protein